MWQFARFCGVAAFAAIVVSSQSALATQTLPLMPVSWLREAAIVAFAFALPALAAGAYLLSRRLVQGIRNHPGLSLGAAGVLTAGVIALLGFEIPGAVRALGIGG